MTQGQMYPSSQQEKDSVSEEEGTGNIGGPLTVLLHCSSHPDVGAPTPQSYPYPYSLGSPGRQTSEHICSRTLRCGDHIRLPFTPEEWELETDKPMLAIQKDGPWPKEALKNVGLVP